MSGPIRVAHVVATVGTTGVEAFLTALLPSLREEGLTATLFVPGEGPLTEKLRPRGIAIEHGAPVRKLDFGAVTRLATALRGRFDLVHAHGPRAAFWAQHAAHRVGLPFLLTVHELRWLTLPSGWRRASWVWLEARGMRHARALTTVSEAARRGLVEFDRSLAPRITVVHSATPLALEGGPSRCAAPFSRGATMRLVTVGRFSHVKGYDLLFESLALAAEAGVDFTLAILGHGPEEGGLRRLAVQLGIANRLEWLGPDADVAARLADADAFVTTTRGESFGIAVLEAMLLGLPVLATAVGSLPEVVTDGETGELVPLEPLATLPARFASALAVWSQDRTRARRFGEAGARRAREQYSPAMLARRMAEVYRGLLAESDRVPTPAGDTGPTPTGGTAVRVP